MYNAATTWVSHTSISDFLACPRAYYLKNIYKNPQTNKKAQIMSPPLALGSAVHEVLESLSVLPTADRLKVPFLERFAQSWKKVSGKRGGFHTSVAEAEYYDRGKQMLLKAQDHPGPLVRKAVKIKADLPQYWLSSDDQIKLCGKIDWLEYLPDSDSVHIIDFKTSTREEDPNSLQLPIYHLLVQNTQHRKVAQASYWYLELHGGLTEKTLPDLDEAHEAVLSVAKKIKTARKLGVFKCPKGDEGCFHCRGMEMVVRGEAEQVGVNDYGQEVFILPPKVSKDVVDESSSDLL